MDDKRNVFEEIYSKVILSKEHSKNANTSLSNASAFEKIQEQRDKQREAIFVFSLAVAGAGISLVIALILIQAIMRMNGNTSFSILENYQLEIISTSIIATVFGIITIITKAIWDDTNYMDILKDDHKNKSEHD